MEEKEQKQKKSVTERGQEAYDKAKQARDTVKKVQDAKKAADAAKAGKAAAQAGKAAAHGSKILTALGPALPYIGIALLIILIILLLIGIIVFLVTMPGMVMDKLKAMFKELGNKVAAFFGGDTTQQIEDEEVYEVLDYLQDMGYDLKGYGFLTEYYTDADIAKVADDEDIPENQLKADNGVIRNTEEDKIAKAESAFILRYIMSDNYIYTVKNFNVINGAANNSGFWNKLWGGTLALLQKLGGIFVDQGALWGKGMIYLIDADGDEWQNGFELDWSTSILPKWETVEVDPGTNTMRITRGAFANAFEFSLDGWTGRYGMPLEFLLSVHIATNMPDLAYDMVEFFGTEVVVKMANATADVKGFVKNDEGDLVDVKELKDIKGSGIDGWVLSKKEAKEIMEDLGFESQKEGKYTCTGTNDATIAYWPSNVNGKSRSDAYDTLKDKQFIQNLDDLERDINDGYYTTWAGLYDYIYENGHSNDDGTYTFSLPNNGALSSAAFKLDVLRQMLEDIEAGWDQANSITGDNQANPFRWEAGQYRYYELKELDSYSDLNIKSLLDYEKKDEISVDIGTWIKTNDQGEDEDYTLELRLISTGLTDMDNWEYSVIIFRDMTQSEIDAKGWNVEDADLCSNNNKEKCCSNCRKYIKRIIKVAKEFSQDDMATYTPYIQQVRDHWYRDVYFEIDSDVEFVNIDAEYEQLMKERWTKYKVYPDDDEFSGNSIWYILGKDGNFIKDFSQAARSAYTKTVVDGEEVEIQDVDESKVLKDSDGYCYYHVETADEAKAVGLSVSRKAMTTVKEGGWSAYDHNSPPETGALTAAYPDTDDPIKKRVYFETTIKNGTKQVEEGVRGVTNEKIKRIFSVNSYFRYDGNPDTAEIIYELRKKVGSNDEPHYGNLNGDTGKDKGSDSTLKANLEKSISKTPKEGTEAKTYTVEEFSGQLDLTKDSLAAFSMLENTHTADADYIYKDFKELIVELGYFDKEELAEHVPEIFQWFIPELGSYGYPMRFADKRENMYGTMAHSYDDYLALKEISIAAAVMEEEVAAGEGQGSQKSYESDDSEWNSTTQLDEDAVRGIGNLLNSNNNANVQTVSGAFSDFTNVSEQDMQLIKAANNTSKGVSPSTVPLKKFLQTTREMCEYINQVGYDYCVYEPSPEKEGAGDYRAPCTCKSNSACMAEYRSLGRAWICNATGCGCETNHCKHNIHKNSCSLPTTFEASKEAGKHNFCCATLVAWALQNVGVMPDEDHMDGAESLATYVETVLGAEKIEKTEELKEGDILVYFGHVDLVGEKKDGGFVKYNGGHHVPIGAVEGQGSDVRYGGSCIEHISGWPEKADYALRLDWGKQEEGVYEGYKGGEAVVSPATGILLEYGEYEGIKPEYEGTDIALEAPETAEGEEAGEHVTSEEKGDRLNYDLRYPFNGVSGTSQAEDAGATVTSGGEEVQPREVYDKVGYAKILVLDNTFYKRLEEHFGISGDSSYQLQHGYKEFNNLTPETLKSWTEEQITLYGYKEFVEKYDAFDLGGYIIYMDGFECELPNPAYDPEEPGDADPSGEELTYEKLLEMADSYEDNMYKPAETYQLSDKASTEKLKAEEETKIAAKPLIKVSYVDEEDGESKVGLFIKEGTVIGRTLTDKEVVEARGETYTEPPAEEDIEEGEEVKREIIGNYIRIVMRDRDDTVVENVEDYLKLDEIPPKPELEMEKFLYWMGVYVEGGKKEQAGGKWISKAVDLSDGVGATHYFGLTKYCAPTAKELGYNVTAETWGQDQDMEMLVNTYLARIEEDKEYVQEQLGADIDDGYLQAFISIKHNYGNLTKRGTEYKNKGSVSESTWTTYEGTQYAAALTKRRISEWKIITEGRYTECYSDPNKDLVFESETPFTDWCAEMGITVSINATKGD